MSQTSRKTIEILTTAHNAISTAYDSLENETPFETPVQLTLRADELVGLMATIEQVLIRMRQ